MELKRGDLIRWVVDHSVYESSGDVLTGVNPNYRHGIIMEISTKDSTAVMVFCYDCKKKRESNWMILDVVHDKLEILSGDFNG